MTITYRTIKGSELTYAEVDENFATITAQYDSVVAAVGDVNQSAAEAANSAASAAQSAISADSSADAAAASETSAFNSAASATASQVAVTDLYDQFDDRYLGSKASAPTLDNDGGALLTGALYWNSVSNKMFVWTGSMWADVVAANASTVQFTPTGGIAATNVQEAIAEVDSEKLATTTYESRAGSQGAISGDRNRVINGSCQIVNVASLAVPDGVQGYGGPEMFFTTNSGAGGQFTQSQGSMVWEGVTLPTIRQTVDTPLTNLSGSNYWHGVVHRIEGFNAFDLLGKPITLSFLFNTNLTGTYSVSVRDGAAAKAYVTVFSAVANTPMQVSISLPAIPLSASLPNSSATGISISVGAQNNDVFATGTLNSWQNGNLLSGGGTSWGLTAGNFIELTNLQLEEGTVATPFIRRSYQQELALTQRYFEKDDLGLLFSGNVTSGGLYYCSARFSVTKRSAPTVSLVNQGAASFPTTTGAVNSSTASFYEERTANGTGVGVFRSSWTADSRL